MINLLVFVQRWLWAMFAAVFGIGGGLLLRAHAAGTDALVSWTQPMNYTDGTPVPASDIAGYTVIWSTGSMQVGANTLSAHVPVPCGSTQFTVTVSTTANAKYPSATSSPSAPPAAYATGVQCTINPPGNVTAK